MIANLVPVVAMTLDDHLAENNLTAQKLCLKSN
jgi:hypothetical protein